MTDPVNHPPHYKAHPSGIECIQITEHMNFNIGNAVKYLWRADEKGNALEDLKKAQWYVTREIARRERKPESTACNHYLVGITGDELYCELPFLHFGCHKQGVTEWSRLP